MGLWGSALGGTAMGAGTGASLGMIGGPAGAPIGAAVGGGLGLLGSLFGAKEDAEARRQQNLLEAEKTRYSPWLKTQVGSPDVGSTGQFGQALGGAATGAQMYQNALRSQKEDQLMQALKERIDKGGSAPAFNYYSTPQAFSSALPGIQGSEFGAYNVGSR